MTASERAGIAGWWYGIGRFRQLLLVGTMVLLPLTLFVFSPQSAHFGWGFLPGLAATALLGMALVFAVFDALHAGLSWLAQGTDHNRALHYRRILLFDALMVAIFGAVLLVGAMS